MNKSQFLTEVKLPATRSSFPTNTSCFNFSYTWSDDTKIIGMVDGELQADSNTINNLSNLTAVVRNSDGIILTEVFHIITLIDLIQLTLDGSSLECNFTNTKGDELQFFSTTSNLLLSTSLTVDITSLIIDKIRIIPFEKIDRSRWQMTKII